MLKVQYVHLNALNVIKKRGTAKLLLEDFPKKKILYEDGGGLRIAS